MLWSFIWSFGSLFPLKLSLTAKKFEVYSTCIRAIMNNEDQYQCPVPYLLVVFWKYANLPVFPDLHPMLFCFDFWQSMQLSKSYLMLNCEQNLSSLFSKDLVLGASITLFGKSFHKGIVLFLKNFRQISLLHLCLYRFLLFPLVCLILVSLFRASRVLMSLSYLPFTILYISTKSPHVAICQTREVQHSLSSYSW